MDIGIGWMDLEVIKINKTIWQMKKILNFFFGKKTVERYGME